MLLEKFAEESLSRKGFSKDDRVVDLIRDKFIECLIIPCSHGLQPEFLLEEGINVEESQVVVLNFNDWVIVCSIDDSCDGCTTFLEFFGLVNNIREAT